MAGKLGIFIIHGMGNPEESYAQPLIDRITSRLGGLAGDVRFASCYWAPILQDQQNETWKRLQINDNMKWKGLREWVVSALGDPASYLSGYMKEKRPVYKKIHEIIRANLSTLASQLEESSSAPIVVLAHSLGSVIISNYLWDEQHGRGVGTSPAECGETIVSFITYGSNIPLFLPPSPPIECIQFPSPALHPKYRNIAQWKNIFSRADVLGYPLADIWDDLHGTKIDDIAVYAGGLLKFWNPMSHTEYHGSNEFLSIVTNEIKKILAVA
ncbi:MAG: hypothetical protein HY089_04860 [Ignavibacteriales bacterium]|nr:hypothetical protein [Ignavibacteriales bacterium]